jgi:transcription antitermination factor NusG
LVTEAIGTQLETLATVDALRQSAPWYAVWTRSHCEKLVADQLSAKGFSPFLPEMSVWSKRSGVSHVVRVPMFPGYLLLRHPIEKRSYIEILKARGVVRILEGGWTRLTPIPDQEVESIQRVVEAGVPVFPHPYFRQGDRARVTDGALAGLEGIFIQDKSKKGRLVLSIDLLGRSVAVEVDSQDITPCSPARLN